MWRPHRSEPLRTLVCEKGLEGEVAVQAKELQRLLDLELSYDLVMSEIESLADYDFTRESWEAWRASRQEHLKKVEEKILPPSLDLEAWSHLIRLWSAVEGARNLALLHPSAFGLNRDPYWAKGKK